MNLLKNFYLIIFDNYEMMNVVDNDNVDKIWWQNFLLNNLNHLHHYDEIKWKRLVDQIVFDEEIVSWDLNN